MPKKKQKTSYRVTGPSAFMGHPPGEEFEADLDPALEERAKARGSIRVTKRGDEDAADDEKEAAADG